MFKNLLRLKAIESIKEVSSKGGLSKTIGPVDLLLLGIGAIIGTGVFVITGVTAAQYSGPAVVLSFALAGFACMFVALAYTEVASMLPTSGNVYSYAYVTMGEFFAWIVGCLLVLEYAVGASAVSAGWSGYVTGMLREGGIIIPKEYTTVPSEGGIINLPAIFIGLVITMILIRGTKESTIINRILVAVKLGAIFIFTLVAVPHFKVDHFADFMPYGFNGVVTGAATIFFAFIGFDMLATAAEECKNPKKDMTIGIIGSLVVCTLIYMVVAGMLVGIVPYKDLNNAEPLAYALRANGSNIGSALVATGAFAGMTTVLLMQMYGQSRIFYVMARDGLLPKAFAKLHPKYQTPYLSNIFIGVVVSIIAGFTPIHVIAQLTSMGTLLAFIVVCVVVLILRVKEPNMERSFRCPAVNIVAPIAIILCGGLLVKLFEENWKPFLIWMVVGTIAYFVYGIRKSKLNDNS